MSSESTDSCGAWEQQFLIIARLSIAWWPGDQSILLVSGLRLENIFQLSEIYLGICQGTKIDDLWTNWEKKMAEFGKVLGGNFDPVCVSSSLINGVAHWLNMLFLSVVIIR